VISAAIICALGGSRTDPDKVVMNLGAEASNGSSRVSQARAGCDVVDPVVVRADYSGADHSSLTEGCIFVCAGVINREELRVEMKDSDGLTIDSDGSARPLSDLGDVRNGGKALGIDTAGQGHACGSK